MTCCYWQKNGLCFLTFDLFSTLLDPFLILLTIVVRIFFLRLAKMSYLGPIATGYKCGRV